MFWICLEMSGDAGACPISKTSFNSKIRTAIVFDFSHFLAAVIFNGWFDIWSRWYKSRKLVNAQQLVERQRNTGHQGKAFRPIYVNKQSNHFPVIKNIFLHVRRRSIFFTIGWEWKVLVEQARWCTSGNFYYILFIFNTTKVRILE